MCTLLVVIGVAQVLAMMIVARAADAGEPAGGSGVAQPGPIARALQPFVDASRLAGAVVLVADRERVLALETVGFADIEARRPMRTDTLFWVASQTKPVTAAALMMLVDEGKVGLDDPVVKYVPEFSGLMVGPRDGQGTTPVHPPSHAITIREILSHTSGLRFLNAKDKMVIDAVPLADAVQHALLEPLLFDPGTAYSYSNEGIDTAGLIVQMLSEMPYERFLQERLFTPLGMSDTSFVPTTEQLQRLATIYRPREGGGLEPTRTGFLRYPLDDLRRHPAPGGGLFSTAHDMMRFCQMFLNGGVLEGRRYLSEAAVREMTKRQTAPGIAESYGLGWGVGPNTYSHGGACSTNMTVDTRRKIITVFLVQHSGFPGDVNEMHKALGDAVNEVIRAEREK